MVRVLPDPPSPDFAESSARARPSLVGLLTKSGAIAQLGEHLLCKQGVVGSIPTGSTSSTRICSAHKKIMKRDGTVAGFVFFENVNE